MSSSSSSPVASSASSWDRITTWASENKAIVYTVGAIAVVVTAAGVVYYVSGPAPKESPKTAKNRDKRKAKELRKAKQDAEAAMSSNGEPKPETPAPESKAVSVETVSDLPEIDEETIDKYSIEERKVFAQKLKVLGNKAYGSKDYNGAIELYTKALVCKVDPVFYSNRAACWNALGDWEKVVEDTSAALAQDREYVKALGRRANAYEKLERYQEALFDYTASAILGKFTNPETANGVERLLKTVAEEKARQMLIDRPKRLPSASVTSNYFVAYRDRPRPAGLEESASYDESTGKGQLVLAFNSLGLKTAAGYNAAAESFEKAVEIGELGEYEPLAYNMRASFFYLKGDPDKALQDLQKAIELDPTYTQPYTKIADINLELGNKGLAESAFTAALEQNENDPDIYYHRGQMHFILGDYASAARDYQKSVELDKDFVIGHIQLAVTQYKNGSIASSMATFRRTIKAFEQSPEAYNYFGEILLDQQKYQEAIEKFDVALDLEKQQKSMNINVLPLINKALAVFQWKQDFAEAESLCRKALILDPESEIGVATMAQLTLQQGKITEALEFFERAAELSRTEGEVINAISFAEATRTQLEVQQQYPGLAARMGDVVPQSEPSSTAA